MSQSENYVPNPLPCGKIPPKERCIMQKLIILAVVLMSLVACGSSDSDTPVTKKPDTEITTNNTTEPTPTAVAQKPTATPTPKPTVSEKVLAIFSEKIYTLSDLEAIGFTKEFNTDYSMMSITGFKNESMLKSYFIGSISYLKGLESTEKTEIE